MSIAPTRVRKQEKAHLDDPLVQGVKPISPRGVILLGAAVIFTLTFVTYIPAMQSGFIWDDDDYVGRIPNLSSVDGLKRIWVEPSCLAQYYPLTYSTFWLEHRLWGMAPAGYHVDNVLLQAACATLLWLALRRLSVKGAFLAGLIFALHPVEAESVAWVTERKNVLSGVFYFLSAIAYLRFAEIAPALPEPANRRRWGMYAASLVLFVLGLLSKSVICSLPAVLLIVLWWKKPSLKWRDVWPLGPMLVLGGAMALVTAWFENTHVGAGRDNWSLTVSEHIVLAGQILWFYASKIVWPDPLVFVYPRWQINPAIWWQWLFPAAALIVATAAFLLRKKLGKGPFVAIAFFALSIAPALGFFRIYYQINYAYVADHFQYIASIGVITLLASGAAWLRHVGKARGSLLLRTIPAGAIAVFLIAMPAVTWRQQAIYKDKESLWTATTRQNPESSMAWNNLGLVLIAKGDVIKSLDYFQLAVDLDGNNPQAHNNLAFGLMTVAIACSEPARKDALFASARDQYMRAGELMPPNSELHQNIGQLYSIWGRYDLAIEEFSKAVEIRADAGVYNDMGVAYIRVRNDDKAMACFRRAIELDADLASAHNNLARLLTRKKEPSEAVRHFEVGTQLDPSDLNAQVEFAKLLSEQGQFQQAADHYRQALKLKPDDARLQAALRDVTARTGQK